MNVKALKILQPDYFNRFACLPDRCLESCCERWQIIIDRETYEKYEMCPNETIQAIVKNGISKNPNSKNKDDYAKINLDPNLSCPFLNEKQLCEVVLHLGEQHLSKTCKSFPRAMFLLENELHRGLEMSCSVAVEEILFQKEGITFEWIEESVDLDDFYVIEPQLESSEAKAKLEKSIALRGQMIEKLQDKSVDLDTRLKNVGLLMAMAAENQSVSKNGSAFLKPFAVLNELMSMKFKEGDTISFFSKGYIDCLMQVLDVYGKVKEKDLESTYEKHYKQYLKPYLNAKPYVLENYLVNYVFVYGLDSLREGDPWEAYMKLCIIYGLILFNLTGLAASHKGMKDDIAVQLIQSLTKTIVADRHYMNSAVSYLQKNRWTDLETLMRMIGK